jgi:hypothetical protein
MTSIAIRSPRSAVPVLSSSPSSPAVTTTPAAIVPDDVFGGRARAPRRPDAPLMPGASTTMASVLAAANLYSALPPTQLHQVLGMAQLLGEQLHRLTEAGVAVQPGGAGLGGAVQPGALPMVQELARVLLQVPSSSLGQAGAVGAVSQALSSTTEAAEGGTFEDRVFSIMQKIVKDKQADVEKRLKDLQKETADAEKKKGGGGIFGKIFGVAKGLASAIPGVGPMISAGMGAIGGAFGIGTPKADTNAESRNLKFEELKNDMQKLSQMQQALSGVLNSLHETAQNAIRAIK